MPGHNLPQRPENFDIQIYKSPKDPKELIKTHVAFTGSPQKHPYDPEKIILIADPYSGDTLYFDFKAADISFAEKLPNISTVEGEIFPQARFWVKKGSFAIRSSPFVVENTREKFDY